MQPDIQSGEVNGSLSGLERVLSTPFLWGYAAVICLVLGGANLYFGELNQDEGWYLYAGQLVHDGKVPYRDFAFTQGPVMAYVYALASPAVKAFGVAGGRLFTALLGLAAALCAAWLAGCMASPERRRAASLLAFILAGVNVYQSYFFTIVKTYSLCALLIILGFLCLMRISRSGGMMWAMAAGILLVLATGTRVSAGIILPVVFLFLLVGRGSPRFAWFWFGLGAGVAACAVFGPFLLAARENFLFGVVQYHTGRKVGGVAAMAAFKAGFISRIVSAYFVAIALFAAWLIARFLRMGEGTARADMPAAPVGPVGFQQRTMTGIAWCAVAAVSLVHFSAPFPYDDYQAAIYPLFAAALACSLASLKWSEKALSWLLATAFVLSLFAAFSSPINQSWVIRDRDRIWWRLKTESSLVQLRTAGARIRGLAGQDRLLLTQDTYLAVESGLRVPAGMEMGPFCYYPDLDDATAASRHVLNAGMFKTLLGTTEAHVAAFSGYGLAIKSPGVMGLSGDESAGLWKIVEGRFRVDAPEIPFFGQGSTTLRIMVRSKDGG